MYASNNNDDIFSAGHISEGISRQEMDSGAASASSAQIRATNSTRAERVCRKPEPLRRAYWHREDRHHLTKQL